MHALARRLDGFAITLTGLCLVHCLALPLGLTLLPLVGANILAGAAFHQALIGLVLPTSLIAFVSGYRRHRRIAVLWLGGAGLALLAATAFVIEPALGALASRAGTSLGGLVLAAAHIANFRLCRRHGAAEHH